MLSGTGGHDNMLHLECRLASPLPAIHPASIWRSSSWSALSQATPLQLCLVCTDEGKQQSTAAPSYRRQAQ